MGPRKRRRGERGRGLTVPQRYLRDSGLALHELAHRLRVAPMTLRRVFVESLSPNLPTAYKIVRGTNGAIQFADLLPVRERRKIERQFPAVVIKQRKSA